MIASFVILFAGVVFYSLRQGTRVAPKPGKTSEPTDPKAISETSEGTLDLSRVDKVISSIKFKRYLVYEGGRSRFVGVELKLKDRDGRPITVTADEADVTTPPDKPNEKSLGQMRGNVTLKTEHRAGNHVGRSQLRRQRRGARGFQVRWSGRRAG